ncbi:hypothetical protein FMM74_007315 [Lachnospiraceae bacterium MD308]|nr:hypothetical protein [Lachnospiraceae bacterium MD308]
MIIAKNDENKRSTLWMAATIGSSVVIILIAVYLLTKLFTSNPLEGSWEDEDGSLSMTIKANGTLTVNVPELLDNEDVDVLMNYTLDRDEKTIAIHLDDDEFERLLEVSDGKYTKEMLSQSVDSVVTTFNYSVDRSCLTLTEREYGEQMIFLKK